MNQGDIVGQYELVRKLGAGAFGEVWLGRHLDLGVERALKIPTDPDYLRQLRQEARIQCAIRHPHIVETIELNIRHATPHFVMEYVEGESLRQRLNREGKLPPAEALRILGQVLDALKAAHAAGILHRDLKPENILLARDGTVKVADFGLGKVQAQITQSLILSGSMMSSSGQSISGTFEYMSPEQRAGKEATPRDDICSVGIMACELLTGRRPPPTGVGKAMQRAGVPDTLAAVVDRACDEFDYRFTSVGEVQAALVALAKAKPSAPPAKPAVPAAPKTPPPLPDLITNSIGMKLKLIPPGSFLMGSDKGEDDEKPVHRVTLTKPFYIGVYPVTQEEYEQVAGSNPSKFKGARRPVEQVSWDDAVEFCRKLSQREGKEYRLPTEAEWEYACRAGTRTEYSFGDSDAQLGDYAWYSSNSSSQTHDVGQKKPNAWGLHDMHGNVWEWCEDWHGNYQSGSETDPGGPPNGGRRGLRGGSWGSIPRDLRSAYRGMDVPGYRSGHFGFRVVLAPGP